MKEYKVGDTIYVKDTVTDIDGDDSTATYYGNHHGWLDNSCIIDELPADPVKPVLPKEVADEISFAKFIGVTFDRYIVRELTRSDYKDAATYAMIQSPDVLNGIEVLLNAWDNGYTVAKEKKYNLILGTDTDDGTNALFKLNYNPCTDDALGLNTDTYADDLKLDELYQFTQEEIDKYNNDFWIKNIDLNDYKIEVTDDDIK